MVVKRTLCILTTILLVLGIFPALTLNAQASFAEDASGTWYETAYATWIGSDTGYRAYVRTLGAVDWRDDSPITDWLEDWEEVDAELVREVDPARDTWRVDIPGLPRGEYEIQVRADDGSTVLHTFDDLETWSFVREGAAFIPSNVNHGGASGLTTNNSAPDGAVGGYLPDGRVNPDAIIKYLTKASDYTGIFSAGRTGANHEKTPLVVRVVGMIYEVTGQSMANNGNTTIEGIGPGSGFFGIQGSNASQSNIIGLGGARNVVIRNLDLKWATGSPIEFGSNNNNIWIHNNTISHGQNVHYRGTDPDQSKGDGETDMSGNNNNWTISYNHYVEGSKTVLVGGGASNNNFYGTFHHNWFDETDERNPRVRNSYLHIYNNLYDKIQGHPYQNELYEQNTGYGIGGGHNANIWAEGNIFDDCNFPMLRSRQGHARGHQAIDYGTAGNPVKDWETATWNAGKNHFFGDSAGYIVTREVVTGAIKYDGETQSDAIVAGDFPTGMSDFNPIPGATGNAYADGLNEAELANLKADILKLQPNHIINRGNTYFDPTLDIGIVVAEGMTNVNPNMTRSPVSQFAWSFRPSTNVNVWNTETEAGIDALREEIETNSGAMKPLPGTEAPYAPQITSVSVNEMRRSVTHQYITWPYIQMPNPELSARPGNVPTFGLAEDGYGNSGMTRTALNIDGGGRVLIHPGTFTLSWGSEDVTTESFEIQWDQGKGEWETIGERKVHQSPNTLTAQPTDPLNRPNNWVTADIGKVSLDPTVNIYAKVGDQNAIYAFRIRAINAAGEGQWSDVYALRGDGASIATVTFDYDGGEGSVESKQVAGGEAYGELPAATKEGYVFLGWSTDGTEDGIVTAETIASSSGHTLTAVWDEDYADGKVRLKLSGPSAVTVGDDGAEYVLSAANLNKLATATLWFEVDGKYFEGKGADGLSGFSALRDIVWENTGGTLWTGRVTLANLEGGVTSDSYVDLFKLTLGLKEELGDTEVKLTRIDLSGYDEDNKAVFFETILRKGEVETSVVQYFSPYDVNRDGKIDQLDLTTAQLYYAAKSDDSDWDEAKIADVNGDGRVDIEDFILILNNIVW